MSVGGTDYPITSDKELTALVEDFQDELARKPWLADVRVDQIKREITMIQFELKRRRDEEDEVINRLIDTPSLG